MRIVFAGTPKFAIPALEALLTSQHKICAVYTKPDSLKGRGLKLTASPIKRKALAANIPIYQPSTFKDATAQRELKKLDADIFIDVAYGLLLPRVVLEMPRFGCINVHPSLLPRWRGAAPIQRAILAGDIVTGVTIMQMDEGLDTGGVLKQKSLEIDPNDTTGSLELKLSRVGAALLLEALKDLQTGKAELKQQDENLACYATKISKEEAKIDWYRSILEIDRMIRAFDPWPIAYAKIDTQTVRFFKAIPIFETLELPPGTIISSNKNGIDVATSNGILRILKMQLPGGRILTVQEILQARKSLFAVGKKFT